MSITISDCLQLASLREADIAGGSGGLNKIVSGVSVLEYADISALESQLFLGNELIITAFVSVKDSVNAQCDVIRRLHEAGEVGLVLYYVGIYVPFLDEKLTKVADELDFPLLVMPINRYNLRYSEVISDVMNAIFIDQRQEVDIVKGLLDQITQLKERQRTHSVVMRILSDRLRCTLLIADRSRNTISFAAWPLASNWNSIDFSSIISKLEKTADTQYPASINIDERIINVLMQPFKTEEQKGLSLFAFDEYGHIDINTLRQAVEVLQLSADIWNMRFAEKGCDALVRAILANQPWEMRRIAIQLRVNIEAISIMWILYDRADNRNADTNKAVHERLAQRLNQFLLDNHSVVLVDSFENCAVAFTDIPRYKASTEDLCFQFSKSLETVYPNLVLVNCQRLQSTEDARNAYVMVESNFDTACKLYPRQKVMSEREFLFANKCGIILSQGEEEVNKYASVLKPLHENEGGNEIINTLACYLIDFQGNMQETADHLFVHKNTVKYRVKKAEGALGYSITKLPEIMDLYMALALDRLMLS